MQATAESVTLANAAGARHDFQILTTLNVDGIRHERGKAFMKVLQGTHAFSNLTPFDNSIFAEMSAAMSAVRERFTNCCNWIGSKQDACSSTLLEVSRTPCGRRYPCRWSDGRWCDPFLDWCWGVCM